VNKPKPKAPHKRSAKQGPSPKPQREAESVEQPYPMPPDVRTLPLEERFDLLLVRYPLNRKALKRGRLEAPGISAKDLDHRREILTNAFTVCKLRRKAVDLEEVYTELDKTLTEELRVDVVENIARRHRAWYEKTKELADHLTGKKPEQLRRGLERLGFQFMGDTINRLLAIPDPKRSKGKPVKPRTQARRNLARLAGAEAAALFLESVGLARPPA